MLSEEKVVVDFLKARLSPKLLEAVELPGLRLEPTSYVDERLKANYSDVVDSLKIRGKPGVMSMRLLITRTPSKRKGILRLLEYMCGLWRDHPTQDHWLPTILPILAQE